MVSLDSLCITWGLSGYVPAIRVVVSLPVFFVLWLWWGYVRFLFGLVLWFPLRMCCVNSSIGEVGCRRRVFFLKPKPIPPISHLVQKLSTSPPYNVLSIPCRVHDVQWIIHAVQCKTGTISPRVGDTQDRTKTPPLLCVHVPVVNLHYGVAQFWKSDNFPYWGCLHPTHPNQGETRINCRYY